MNLLRKWLKVPASNETKEIEVAQTWEVRWHSLKGRKLSYKHTEAKQQEWEVRYGSDEVRPECEVFLSSEDAEQFAASLQAEAALWSETIARGNIKIE